MWRYYNPVRITFGGGCLAELGTALAGRGYVLVTYGEPHFRRLAERVAGLAGQPLAIVDEVAPNPDFATLPRVCARLKGLLAVPEVLVALGGGSVIDTAKAMAAAGGDYARVRRYLEEGQGGDQLSSLPIIALPTTAGTGSEVTCGAALWDRRVGKKYSLAQPELYPEQALVDPELMLDLPRAVTVSTGLDALSHALEAIWNVNANPVSTALAVSAAREVLDSLVPLAANLGSLELRTRMARAALAAGLAFSSTKTALAHSLSYPISLEHGVPHGLACSFSLPLVMRGVLGESADCDAALQRIFGPDLEAGAGRLEAFLVDLGVSVDPADYGVSPAAFQALIAAAFEGERGRNFIGRRERMLETAARCLGRRSA